MIQTKKEISVCVGTYAKYNNAPWIDPLLYFEWVDLTKFVNEQDFLNYCAKIHSDEQDPEIVFKAFEGFPQAYYGESRLDRDLWGYLETIKTEDKEIIDTLIENGFSYDQSFMLIDNSFNDLEKSIGYWYLFESGIYEVSTNFAEDFEDYIDLAKIGGGLMRENKYLEYGDKIIAIIRTPDQYNFGPIIT